MADEKQQALTDSRTRLEDLKARRSYVGGIALEAAIRKATEVRQALLRLL
jgi:hypothetical protein